MEYQYLGQVIGVIKFNGQEQHVSRLKSADVKGAASWPPLQGP